MSAIFISYSSKDRQLASDLCARLRARDYRSVFLDQDRDTGISPGDKWETVLYRELRSCQLVIALISENWLKSQWCFAEATHAREKGKTILGLNLQPYTDCSLLGDSQLIDFTLECREQGYERLWSALGKLLDWRGHLAWDVGRPPYPGLDVFEEQDASIYFGRDEQIHELKETLERLRRQRHKDTRFVTVLGASGSGKSSLVRAGVVPVLRRTGDDWLVVGPFRPQEQFFDSLAQAFARAFASHGVNRDWKELRDMFAADPGATSGDALADVIGDLRMRSCTPNSMVLLVVDQLEEILSCPADHSPPTSTDSLAASQLSEARRDAMSLLRRLIQLPGRCCMVLGTLRSDFLGDFQQQPELTDIDYESFHVGTMRASEFAAVIEGPASLANLRLEPGLTGVIVDDTVTNDALPLLAFTLNRLWTMFGGNGCLTIDQYRTSLGGLQGALDRWAEDALPSHPLTAAHERILRATFLSLVRLSEEGQLLRRSARWQDLPAEARPLLSSYVQARLLVSRSARPDGGEIVVEVAHETLFRAWTRLRGWLQGRETQELLAWREGLHLQMSLWERSNEDVSLLLQPAQLRTAMRWLKTWPEILNAQDRKFIQTSVRISRRASRRAAAIAAFVLLLVAVAGWRVAVKSDWYEFYRLDSTTKAVINREFLQSLQSTLNTGLSTYTFLEKVKDVHVLSAAADLPEVRTTLKNMRDALGVQSHGTAAGPIAACKESIDYALELAQSPDDQRIGVSPVLVYDDEDMGGLKGVIEACKQTSSDTPTRLRIQVGSERLATLVQRMRTQLAQIDLAAAERRGRAALNRAVEERVRVDITYGNDAFSTSIEQRGQPKAEETAERGLTPEQARKVLTPAAGNTR